MNYYQRHLGDYAKDTGHLTLLEHGVYTVLLDWTYATERALPEKIEEIFRICRAFSKIEKAAVQRVCAEFFPQGLNKRAMEEIDFCSTVSQQKRFGILRRHHPELKELSDEQLEEWCKSNRHLCSTGEVKYRKSTVTRARSNSQQPTAIVEGGGAQDSAAACQVSDAEILAWAAAWPGEPASATPPMAAAWVHQALVKINGRNAWPSNWQRWLVACWRVEHRPFSAGEQNPHSKKNAAGNGVVSASVTEIGRQKRIAELSDEEDGLAYDVNALRANNIEVPKAKTERLLAIREELKKLRAI